MKTLSIEKLNPRISDHEVLVRRDLYAFMVDNFREYYPDFENWYQRKVIRGFLESKRAIYLVKGVSGIYGVSILRLPRSSRSNKICSFFILPEIRGKDIGLQLMSKSLEEFASSQKPLVITVPEERLEERMGGKGFLGFLKAHGFDVVEKAAGKYRPGKIEYILLRLPQTGSTTSNRGRLKCSV